MSPEILSPDVDIEYGYEVDHWAFGVIIYELFIGKPPYITNSREEMLKQIVAHILIPHHSFVYRKNLPLPAQFFSQIFIMS